jgi:hypothetical protein
MLNQVIEHKLTLARTPVAIAQIKEVDFILPLDSDLLSIRLPCEKMARISLVPLKCHKMHSRTSSNKECQNLMRGPFHPTEKRFTFQNDHESDLRDESVVAGNPITKGDVTLAILGP